MICPLALYKQNIEIFRAKFYIAWAEEVYIIFREVVRFACEIKKSLWKPIKMQEII